MSLNTFSFELPVELERVVSDEIEEWKAADAVSRIWARDATVWTGDDEAKWLGWLDIVDEELADLEKYRELRDDLDEAAFDDVLLMGMGGSSLCPEVLALTFGRENFHILDSTVPAEILSVEKQIDLERTLFIVASKSGSTLEPNCFKEYFFEKLASHIGREGAGRQFIAITDPGSKMERVAKDHGFRHIFYGKPEIGGRFSALSAFGLTAATAMGIDVEGFLRASLPMVDACREADVSVNPGAVLGLILGVCHARGRDKLTIFVSPEIHDLGAWLEQLIAESTGKNGVAIIPVDREPLAPADHYSSDRVFAFLTLAGNGDERFGADMSALAEAGHPVIHIELDSIGTIGQEFFRWEFATAVAGSVMQINPFNQPDVESAKIEARKLTDQFKETGEFPAEQPLFEEDGFSLFAGGVYAAELQNAVEVPSVAAYVGAHLNNIGPGDYFALLAYVEMDEENETPLDEIRGHVLADHAAATCLGFGPRFLHSTGQAYKGGGNNGLFLQITSDDETDLRIPGMGFTFGTVKQAQARGDFQVLLDRGRRALRVHLDSDVAASLAKLAALI
jgi:transaldolase/glucose-6-phosphate isomerase